jgi:membrane-associated protease RseP (regulator of RpoE activity)
VETGNRGLLSLRSTLINSALLLLTLLTTAIAGVQWVGKDPFEIQNLPFGLEYAFAIIFVLGSHEFGHYFAARHHRVTTTLPYFIPFPPVPFFLNFGTLGALIRTRSPVPNRKAMFDIGVAGPIAGFVACIIVLVIGFLTLPPPSYILQIHPDYDFSINASAGGNGLGLEFGQTLLFKLLTVLLTNPQTEFVPPMSEIYHYPLLCVGWFGLFVTAMNLIPIGQFDGGHLSYTMFGEKHKTVSKVAFGLLLVLGLPSIVDSILSGGLSLIFKEPIGQVIPLAQYSWGGWFLWAMISYFVIKLYHPPIPDETALDESRLRVGWLTFVIFILCFSLVPFTISM